MRLKLLLFVGATRAALATYHRSRSQASLDQCIDFAIIVCIQVVAFLRLRALMENLEHVGVCIYLHVISLTHRLDLLAILVILDLIREIERKYHIDQ